MSEMAGYGGSSFERMRAMLLRAAEIREDEQTQVFDALDEIAARLAGLDALGTVRKRVAELPDRAAVTGLADRVEQVMTALTAVDGAVGSLAPAVEAVPGRITPEFSALGERFEALGGRVDTLAGRIDGMEQRAGATGAEVGHLSTELTALRGELERLPDAVADALSERLRDAVTGPLAREASSTREQLTERVAALEEALSARLTEEREAAQDHQSERLRAEVDRVTTAAGEVVTEAWTDIAGEITELTAATKGVDERLAAIRSQLLERFDERLTAVNERVERLCGEVASRPDAEALTERLREFADDVATRHREALDEAMATFAELTVTPSPVSLPLARSSPDQGRRVPQRIRHTPRRTRHPFADTDPDAVADDPDADQG